MGWHVPVWHWLAQAALGSSVLLLVGCLAVRLCRQPVRRLRLIELTLGGCLLVPWLGRLPGVPHLSAGRLPGPAAEAPPPETPVASAAEEAPRPVPNEDAAPARTRASGVAPARLPAVARSPVQPAAAPVEASAPSEPTASWSWPPVTALLVLAYTAAVGVLVLRWLTGLMRLVRLCRRALPAPRPVVEILRQIAGPRGGGVRVLVTDRLDLPVMFGGWRPVILLPAAQCTGDDPSALRYSLAHEWSHVERHDAWRWHVAALAQLLFFYQPLFWWLRRQLRLCQDYLADARAAEEAAAAADYAAFLVALARRPLRGPVPAALGIGDRRSNLYRRVLMLIEHRQPLERRCRRLWTLGATLAATLLLAAVSAVRLDAGDPPAKPEPAKNTKSYRTKLLPAAVIGLCPAGNPGGPSDATD